MKYFTNCKTIEELKKEYRRLALENHPDRGGDEQVMKAINLEYEKMAKILENVHEAGEEAPKHKAETPKEFIEIIDKLIRMTGVVIEICGSWLWLTGNTYEHRQEIAEMHFRFSKTKKAWYWFNGIENTTKHRGTNSMNEIRNKYGSEKIFSEEMKKIEA